MRDGSRPRFTASLPRRFYGRALLISTLKSPLRAPARPGMLRGSQRWWIHRCDLWLEWDVLRGQSVLDPAAREPSPFLKRSFVLIAAIDRPSARRFLYVPRNRWQVPCLYHFNALSAHELRSCNRRASDYFGTLRSSASNFQLPGWDPSWEKCTVATTLSWLTRWTLKYVTNVFPLNFRCCRRDGISFFFQLPRLLCTFSYSPWFFVNINWFLVNFSYFAFSYMERKPL